MNNHTQYTQHYDNHTQHYTWFSISLHAKLICYESICIKSSISFKSYRWDIFCSFTSSSSVEALSSFKPPWVNIPASLITVISTNVPMVNNVLRRHWIIYKTKCSVEVRALFFSKSRLSLIPDSLDIFLNSSTAFPKHTVSAVFLLLLLRDVYSPKYRAVETGPCREN